MSGKGSSPRPLSVSQDQFAEAWERTFGNADAAPAECVQTYPLTGPPIRYFDLGFSCEELTRHAGEVIRYKRTRLADSFADAE